MSEGNDDNWEMPKPVFRSTTGGLPKSFEDTINQSFSPDSDTVEIDEDDDILGVMEKPPAESEEVIIQDVEPPDPEAAAKAEKDAVIEAVPKGAAYWTFARIFLLLALLAAAFAVLLFYYFTRKVGTDGTF